MKGFPIAHIFHPSIPPMYAVVNNHNRNIDYWTVKESLQKLSPPMTLIKFTV